MTGLLTRVKSRDASASKNGDCDVNGDDDGEYCDKHPAAQSRLVLPIKTVQTLVFLIKQLSVRQFIMKTVQTLVFFLIKTLRTLVFLITQSSVQ